MRDLEAEPEEIEAALEALPEPSELSVVLSVRDIEVGFGETLVLKGLDLDVYDREILGFVGGSGQGKSVLLRTILGLLPRRKGMIEMFGMDLDKVTGAQNVAIDRRTGVLFQHGALFSGLTVRENIQFPMREYLAWPQRLMDEVSDIKLDLVGLPRTAAAKYPSELSGGMIKRAALARSLALDPDLIFLDEPTSGLDPIGAAEFDELIVTLRDTLGLTVYMVTHDLDSLHVACDRVAVLSEGKILTVGPVDDVARSDDPWIRDYFKGKRSRFEPAQKLAAAE